MHLEVVDEGITEKRYTVKEIIERLNGTVSCSIMETIKKVLEGDNERIEHVKE